MTSKRPTQPVDDPQVRDSKVESDCPILDSSGCESHSSPWPWGAWASGDWAPSQRRTDSGTLLEVQLIPKSVLASRFYSLTLESRSEAATITLCSLGELAAAVSASEIARDLAEVR